MDTAGRRLPPGLSAPKGDVVKYYKDMGLTEQDISKIRGSAEEFEAIFLEIMLKSMRSTVPKDGLVSGGNGEDIYRSMLDYEYAKGMASQRGSGIADTIERQLLDSMIKQVKIESPSAGHAVYKQQAQSVPLQESAKQGTIRIGDASE
jgi:Rod binding domain-containing protein